VPTMAAKLKSKSARQTPKVESRPADPVEMLATAMQRAFGMAPDDALETAAIVAERFAGVNEVNDDTIDADVRSLFYTLEAKRLLSFRRVEYDNEHGEKRRAFWWRIRTDVLEELVSPVVPENEDVYASLPSECWRREVATS
jgi:hypothetical protein